MAKTQQCFGCSKNADYEMRLDSDSNSTLAQEAANYN
jgi:hypothetical protein